MGISELLKKADISHTEIDRGHKLSQDEKLNEIMAELKALSIAISQHDQNLTKVENNILERINELLERRKEIPAEKKLEAEDIIKNAKNRAEAIEKLISIGISQATAYRYTEILEKKKKK